jgi:hypothetical protein
MTFADLEKKISASTPGPTPMPSPPSTVQNIEREFRRVDLLQLATGLFILVIGISGNLLDPGVHKYAEQWIGRTVVCEMYMLWLGMGAWLAIGKPTWARIPILIGTVALYLAVITHDSQFSFVPQAAWLLFVRLVPPGFVGLFSDQNVRRVKAITLTGLACLVGQIVLFAMGSSALVAFGVGTNIDHVITAPRWFSAFVWGAYYIELAFLLPYVERNLDKFG